jgi:hypothetical protein
MPAKGTFGNSGPNNFRGPRINNWDLTLMKRIPLVKNEKRELVSGLRGTTSSTIRSSTP